MRADIVPLLINPITHNPLHLAFSPDGHEALFDNKTGQMFPIRNGIPDFLTEITGSNKKAQSSYDLFAPLYDSALWVWEHIEKNAGSWRRDFLSAMDIKEGSKVLEVSIGTGDNLPLMPKNIEYFGLDISLGMLKKCERNLRKWNRRADLFLGMAEDLPFADKTFDAVFHIGGINFFNDKTRAIDEMIRVAKSGTLILNGDETEKAFRWLKWIPLLGRNYDKLQKLALPPVDQVPKNMIDVKVDYLLNGLFYRLSFKKP
jgi:ubiquinone/menaquinone biosynthesis C-methylase UbiE